MSSPRRQGSGCGSTPIMEEMSFIFFVGQDTPDGKRAIEFAVTSSEILGAYSEGTGLVLERNTTDILHLGNESK